MSSYGKNLHFSVFGQSHADAIGVTAEGIPAGEKIDMEALSEFMARRAGGGILSTPRKEPDIPEFLCGLKNGVTCGSAITAIIRNTNVRSGDYSNISDIPRPAHADFAAREKFGESFDNAGGGQFSGRLTAPLCVIGGICKQLLEKEGIHIFSRISSIGRVYDSGELTEDISKKPFLTVSDEAGEKMREEILAAKAEGDSVGGVIECVVTGLPTGLGDALFDGIDGRISLAVFGIPAVKGIEFGAGFAAAELYGSENNDAFYVENGKIITKTNNCGGILGGITNGMPINFRVAFKPTPSISKEQESVDLKNKTSVKFNVRGRHDPCIVPRAAACVEAATAVAIYDAVLERRKENK